MVFRKDGIFMGYVSLPEVMPLKRTTSFLLLKIDGHLKIFCGFIFWGALFAYSFQALFDLPWTNTIRS